MAEPIGIASGLLAISTFAFQSSVALCNTIRSFQSHPKRVRDLIEELEAFNQVLGPLIERVSANNEAELSALDMPLKRCGNSCKEFEQEIVKCSSRSAGGRTSFRDWAKLRYIGDDIDGFRRLVAGYKLTIVIALTDANLRKSTVTIEGLKSHKELIQIATADLEARLEHINEKLEIVLDQASAVPDSDTVERRLMREEQASTQRCLQICAQLADHIDQIQITTSTRESSPGSADSHGVPEMLVNAGLQDCKNSLMLTAKKLERHMRDVMDRLVAKSKTAMTSEEDAVDLVRLQEEWQTARQCVDICSAADIHLRESVSIIDNYATGDAVQFMVSTDGKTIHGKNRGLGWRTRQVGGHLSDVSVQQLSRDMTGIYIRNNENEGVPLQADRPSIPTDGLENDSLSAFGHRYGRGVKLKSNSGTEPHIPPQSAPSSSQQTPTL